MTTTSKHICPLTTSSRKRRAASKQAVSIKGSFPPGVAQPALRALAAAGLTSLDQLVNVSEQELLRLHGLGPKAINTLRAALEAEGKSFRQS